MRDFGAADTDLAATAEPLDGPFVQRLTALAGERDTTVVAGMFEVSDDPARPYNTLVVVDRDGLRASYRKIHLYDSFGYKESDRLVAGSGRAGARRRRRLPGRPDDLLRPALPRAGPRAGRPGRRAARRARRLGRRPAQGATTGARWRRRGRSRTPSYVAAVGQPGPRYTGHSLVVGPAGEVVAELGDGDHVLAAVVDRDALERGPRHQPVAGQPPLLGHLDGPVWPAPPVAILRTSAAGGRHDLMGPHDRGER